MDKHSGLHNGDVASLHSAVEREGSVDLDGDLLAGLDIGSSSKKDSARATPIPFTSSADTSILPIVTSQRDRFRQRNAELEEVRISSPSLPS